MKFKSKDGQDKRVVTTDGHLAVIGTEWRELPEHLHSLAYAAGCISEDMAGKTTPTVPAGVITVESVREAIKAMLTRNEPSDFTKAGLPDRAALNKFCNGKVPNEVFETAWAQLSKESEV